MWFLLVILTPRLKSEPPSALMQTASNFLSGAGSAFQVDSTFEGSLIANLSGSITDGAGNDQIKGSQASDFIRVVKATTTSTAALAMTSSVLVAATTP